jgi:hypothetical protein
LQQQRNSSGLGIEHKQTSWIFVFGKFLEKAVQRFWGWCYSQKAVVSSSVILPSARRKSRICSASQGPHSLPGKSVHLVGWRHHGASADHLTGMTAVLALSLGTTITKVRRHQLAAPQLVVPAFVIRLTLRARRVVLAHVNWGFFYDSEVLGIGWLRTSERNFRLCYDVHRRFLILRLARHRVEHRTTGHHESEQPRNAQHHVSFSLVVKPPIRA